MPLGGVGEGLFYCAKSTINNVEPLDQLLVDEGVLLKRLCMLVVTFAERLDRRDDHSSEGVKNDDPD